MSILLASYASLVNADGIQGYSPGRYFGLSNAYYHVTFNCYRVNNPILQFFKVFKVCVPSTIISGVLNQTNQTQDNNNHS